MRESVSSLFEEVTATISLGQSLTSSINLGGLRVFGIKMPASWDTANLTFQVSLDGGTWTNMYLDDDSEYTAKAAASRFIVLPVDKFCGVPFIKIRSGTSGSPVNQTADRTLTLALRQL